KQLLNLSSGYKGLKFGAGLNALFYQFQPGQFPSLLNVNLGKLGSLFNVYFALLLFQANKVVGSNVHFAVERNAGKFLGSVARCCRSVESGYLRFMRSLKSFGLALKVVDDFPKVMFTLNSTGRFFPLYIWTEKGCAFGVPRFQKGVFWFLSKPAH